MGQSNCGAAQHDLLDIQLGRSRRERKQDVNSLRPNYSWRKSREMRGARQNRIVRIFDGIVC